jgi:hypothetical protein
VIRVFWGGGRSAFSTLYPEGYGHFSRHAFERTQDIMAPPRFQSLANRTRSKNLRVLNPPSIAWVLCPATASPAGARRLAADSARALVVDFEALSSIKRILSSSCRPASR